jgi:predicted anti-sigma-YlaC factor YlaD
MNARAVERVVSIAMRPWVATCEETQERLSAHLEGDLRGHEAKRVLRHLARCPHCREALRTLARAVSGLRALGQADSLAPARPSFANGVVGRIRDGDA